jgi:tetratricopeptide (TPR) repeat protein
VFIKFNAIKGSLHKITWPGKADVLGLLVAIVSLAGCASNGSPKPQVEPEIVYEKGSDAPLVSLPNPYLQQEIAVSPEVRQAFTQGVGLMKASKWNAAELHFDALSQANPSLAGPWINLGICLWRQEHYKPAAQAFEQAIAANKYNMDAYLAYGVMAREQGQFDRAEQLYKNAIAVWPHNAVAHRNLGVLYDMYMGRFDDALAHFEMTARIMGEPDKELQGWIIDIKRRQAQELKKPDESEPDGQQTTTPSDQNAEVTQ